MCGFSTPEFNGIAYFNGKKQHYGELSEGASAHRFLCSGSS